MRTGTGWLMTAAAVAVLAPGLAGAQQAGNANDPWCRNSGWSNEAHYCEVRELTMMPPSGVLTINADPNGGIAVKGWQQREVAIRARITAQADTDEQAQSLARGVMVRAEGDTIASNGPRQDDDRHWSVSYEVSVPFDHPLSLVTRNGGISLTGMRSNVEFGTKNGGVSLKDVGGNVKGRTQNGGISVVLGGDRWEGDGLDVETHNGGVNLVVPEHFAAHLETSTVNGRVSIDFPITLTGELDRRHVTTDLNGGGARVRLVTTNGGVSVRKR